MCINRIVALGFTLMLIPVASLTAQQRNRIEDSQRPNVSTGSATAGEHAPILDANHRPITAGGFVKSGPIIFKDVTASAGLATWSHKMGSREKTVILESIGSGVALLDYDNDGWLDIYLVNGSTFDAASGKTNAPHAALFHNNHDGTFTNRAKEAGVTNDRWGFGAVVGDFDNDGWADIYVSNYGHNRLYHNNRDGTFTDVAQQAGVLLGGWSTGSTWGDYDGDGLLDLFVPGYVHFEPGQLQSLLGGLAGGTFCSFRGANVMCGPRGLEGERDHLFHNNGNGTFTDVSEKAGVADRAGYFGLASVFVDINGDGRPDLLVANDSTPNYLYLNKGDGTFEDISYASGYALNASGRETASMGIAVGDFSHSGRPSIYHTTFSDDYNPLYRNDGGGNFTEISYEMGIAEPTIPFLGWGTAFLDFDNDGWLDLFVSNGHVYPQVDAHQWGTSWAQRPLLFHNIHGVLKIVPPVEGTALSVVATGRGMASGDLFNDGKIDVVVNNLDSTPSLFRNVDAGQIKSFHSTDQRKNSINHWISLTLIGGPNSPRDAVGAVVFLTAGGIRQRADVLAGGSFESSSDKRIHFGLGQVSKIEKIEILWPDGVKQLLSPPTSLDTYFSIKEGGVLVPKHYSR